MGGWVGGCRARGRRGGTDAGPGYPRMKRIVSARCGAGLPKHEEYHQPLAREDEGARWVRPALRVGCISTEEYLERPDGGEAKPKGQAATAGARGAAEHRAHVGRDAGAKELRAGDDVEDEGEDEMDEERAGDEAMRVAARARVDARLRLASLRFVRGLPAGLEPAHVGRSTRSDAQSRCSDVT